MRRGKAARVQSGDAGQGGTKGSGPGNNVVTRELTSQHPYLQRGLQSVSSPQLVLCTHGRSLTA